MIQAGGAVVIGAAAGFTLIVAAAWVWLCFGADYDLGEYP